MSELITVIRVGQCSRGASGCNIACCEGDPFRGQNGPAAVAGYCPLLRLDSDGLGLCSDRNHPYNLAGCRVYPVSPQQVPNERCSYAWVTL